MAVVRDWDEARRAWEGDPQETFAAVADRLKVSRQAVRKRATRDGWRKLAETGELSRLAVNQADAKMVRELVVDKEDKQDAVAQRAEVIARHRREWDGARKAIYKAVRADDMEAARLGKAVADALAVIQSGERKAWQLDERDAHADFTVVIEREVTA